MSTCLDEKGPQYSDWTARIILYAPYLLCLVFYFWISRKLGLDVSSGAPDEIMRALLPEAISQGNILPSGYDQEVIYHLGYWSYAFYPQLLPAYLSALFMTASRLLGMSEGAVFMNGRLASIVFSILALYFTSRTTYRLATSYFNSEKEAALVRSLTVIYLGFWPQYAFLSSYMNNDIAAFCGAAIIIDALSQGVRTGWRRGNTVQLALGIIIAALSYWNAYPFILISVPIYLITLARQGCSAKEKRCLLVLIVLIVIIGTAPFYLTNIIRYHDLVGIRTFNARYQQWLDEGNEVLRKPFSGGLVALIMSSDYVSLTVKSFVGVFGYMYIYYPDGVYSFYLLSLFAGVLGFAVRRKQFSRNNDAIVILWTAVMAACLIVVGLSVYYTLSADYQPQGRYIIYLLLPFVIMACLGWASLIREPSAQESPKKRVGFTAKLAAASSCYISICLWMFWSASQLYGWAGVAF